MNNIELAKTLQAIADLLEAREDNPYRVRAYRKAASTIRDYPETISSLITQQSDLTLLPGIGKVISEHISTIVQTGKLPDLFTRKLPKHFRSEFKLIPGLGSKKIQLLNQHGIITKKDLVKSISDKTLIGLPGFTASFIKQLKINLKNNHIYEKYFNLHYATKIADSIKNKLMQFNEVETIIVVGDLRRQVEIIGNIDFVIKTKNSNKVSKQFLELAEINQLITVEKNFLSVILNSRMQISIYFVSSLEPFLILFLTGSGAHYDAIKSIAKEKGFLLNEKGLFNEKPICCRNEQEIYQQLSLVYIEPELRENRGEITASKHNTLPKLINQEDIKGDLHCHTRASDGNASLERMVKAALDKGYEYLAITDHSKRLKIARGLSEEELLQQIELIDELNSKHLGIVILKSSEVDILEDGSLDYSSDILKRLDLRICSIHSKFNLSKEKQTSRIIKAMDNPYFNMLGHPTGRLIYNIREPYEIDLPRVLEAAKARGCFIEINCQPARLDLQDIYCNLAKSLGVKMAISSDAHSVAGLNYIRYGIAQARRGWLSAEDVINTQPLAELIKLLKRN